MNRCGNNLPHGGRKLRETSYEGVKRNQTPSTKRIEVAFHRAFSHYVNAFFEYFINKLLVKLLFL